MSAQGEPARQTASPVTAAEFAARLSALAPSKQFAVAFSGGPDSLALLILSVQWAKRRKGVSLHAFTVDHGLRAASAVEARRAAAMAKALGVPHRILRWKGEKPASGIQAAAREAARADAWGAQALIEAAGEAREDPAEALWAAVRELPAKQRETHPNDWMTTDIDIAGSDPNCGARYRITRVGRRRFRHGRCQGAPGGSAGIGGSAGLLLPYFDGFNFMQVQKLNQF